MILSFILGFFGWTGTTVAMLKSNIFTRDKTAAATQAAPESDGITVVANEDAQMQDMAPQSPKTSEADPIATKAESADKHQKTDSDKAKTNDLENPAPVVHDEQQAPAVDDNHPAPVLDAKDQAPDTHGKHQEPVAHGEHQASMMNGGSPNEQKHGVSTGTDQTTDHIHEMSAVDERISAHEKTPDEIAAFVEHVIHKKEAHAHNDHTALVAEHMAVLDLVPRDAATHIAIGNGSWFDPRNWHNGEVPGDDAKVLIPASVTIDYDQISDARLFTLRVDGQLDFATDTDSKIVVDTFVVAPTGTLTIGTQDNPVNQTVDVDIIIANNGAIDTNWDPMLLSRGLISHGDVTIHGAVKDSHERVIEDPMAGDTSIRFEELPIGWKVGDTIVIAGTNYDGYKFDKNGKIEETHENEVRVISHIDGATVHFETALRFDHDTPRADLKTSVANYSRNISVETENPDSAEVYERGHAMFMHSDNVDVRYAEFHKLGRTDKSAETFIDDGTGTSFDSNVKGRYGLHIHRAGTENVDDPAILIGNSVFGSPGWGFVHHDSNAVFDNNASYDTFGAGFVAESGNEIGVWNDNIAIYAPGWGHLKGGNDLETFDTGRTGDGFWFQGRMVESTNNVAASVNTGFAYFHRGEFADNAQIPSDPSVLNIDSAFHYHDTVGTSAIPILSFSNNEVQASFQGLHVLKASPNQGHDIHSVFDGFTAWNVEGGAHFQYTAHYLLKNFDLVSRTSDSFDNEETGITFGNNVTDFVILDATLAGFDTGIDLYKRFLNTDTDTVDHDYIVINPEFIGYGQTIKNFDPVYDTLLDEAPDRSAEVSVVLDAPLVYLDGHAEPDHRFLPINGTKTDSLGSTEYPTGSDHFDLRFTDVISILNNSGYYSANDGNKYFVLDMYSSDRLTGETFKQSELVKIDQSVPLHTGVYKHVVDNGAISLDALKAQAQIGKPVPIDFGQAADSNIFATYEDTQVTMLSHEADDLWNTLTSDQDTLDESTIHLEHDHHSMEHLDL